MGHGWDQILERLRFYPVADQCLKYVIFRWISLSYTTWFIAQILRKRLDGVNEKYSNM